MSCHMRRRLEGRATRREVSRRPPSVSPMRSQPHDERPRQLSYYEASRLGGPTAAPRGLQAERDVPTMTEERMASRQDGVSASSTCHSAC
jgi:hypothetical protein